MKKPERVKLQKQTRKLLSAIGGKVNDWSDRSFQTTIPTEANGLIEVTFFNAQTAKDTPWLACQLRGWPKTLAFGQGWNGFRHWKQNVHAFNLDTAEEVVRLFSEHLRQLGVSHETLEA